MKFAHLILCGLAAFALPTAALAKDAPQAQRAATTLFPGAIDIPVANGSNVPANCDFPATLTGSGMELACVVATNGAAEDEVGIEYIAWLGQNGWRHSADIIGGFAATKENANGCEQTLSIYPHGDEGETSGIWFALEREPRCAAPAPSSHGTP